MDFNQFEEVLVREIRKRVNDKYEIILNDVTKNNGLVLRSIVIKTEEQKVSPSIYLEKYYEEYKDGGNIETIAEEIIEISQDKKHQIKFDTDLFTDYEKIKDKLFVKLISFERNEGILRTMPYRKFLDMAIVMYCDVSDICGVSASVVLNKDHISAFPGSEEEILDYAIYNTRKNLGVMIKSFQEFFDADFLNDSDFPLSRDFDSKIMYVYTNKNLNYGAACMLYEDVLSGFCAGIDTGVYILPSSIHEIILVPDKNEVCGEALSEMVRSVNSGMQIEEILSDRAYYFSRDGGFEMI